MHKYIERALLFYQKLALKINNLSLRERLFIFIGCSALLGLLWFLIIMLPIMSSHSALALQKKYALTQSNLLQSKIDSIIKLSKNKGVAPGHAALMDAVQNLNQTLNQMEQQIVPIKRMVEILRAMLVEEKYLKLVKLSNLPDKPLVSSDIKVGGSAFGLFEQGIELEFEGDYFKTLDFLKRLEHLEWQVFWDKLDYQVIKYPAAKITLRLHTLSLIRED